MNHNALSGSVNFLFRRGLEINPDKDNIEQRSKSVFRKYETLSYLRIEIHII